MKEDIRPDQELENLIAKMQEVKTKFPSLEITEILRLFNILATKELTKQIRRLANKK